MMNNEIFIYGGGGHGKVVIDIIRSSFETLTIAGIFDDDPLKFNQDFYGCRILGSIKNAEKPISTLILAIGNNFIRKNKAEFCKKMIENFATIIDKSALISSSVQIKSGTVVMPGAKINANVLIGHHCIINTGAIIEHDCQIGHYSHIAPGSVLTGDVCIGDLTLIGANATIIPGIKIGNHCLIGAGSVITRNIPDNSIAQSNPAKLSRLTVKGLRQYL